jgi:hypothetical protein
VLFAVSLACVVIRGDLFVHSMRSTH